MNPPTPIDWDKRKQRARAYIAERKLKLVDIPKHLKDRHQYFWQETTHYAYEQEPVSSGLEGDKPTD